MVPEKRIFRKFQAASSNSCSSKNCLNLVSDERKLEGLEGKSGVEIHDVALDENGEK